MKMKGRQSSFQIRSWVIRATCTVTPIDTPHFRCYRSYFLSANDLVDLNLRCIGHPGYISPEVMVASSLSSMTKLQASTPWPRIRFPSIAAAFPSKSTSTSEEMHTPPCSHSLFFLKGVSEYVKDFVARVDTPLLHRIRISVFNQLIFYIPRLPHIINLVGR